MFEEDWVNYHDVSLITKKFPQNVFLFREHFQGEIGKRILRGNHLCDLVELSCFHRGDWNWAFDSGTHPCVTQLDAMWIFQCERSSNSPLISEWPKIIAIMLYSYDIFQILFKYSNIHQCRFVSYFALIHHPQVLGKISEKNLKESGLELEDHPWLDGWRELREAELRSGKIEVGES